MEEHIHELEDFVLIAIYCFIGLLIRIVIDYFRHSNKVEKAGGRFKGGEFIRKYDQDWILGLVASIGFAAGGEYLWSYGLGPLLVKYNAFEAIPPFNHKLGIAFGLFSTEVGMLIGTIIVKIRKLLGGND